MESVIDSRAEVVCRMSQIQAESAEQTWRFTTSSPASSKIITGPGACYSAKLRVQNNTEYNRKAI